MRTITRAAGLSAAAISVGVSLLVPVSPAAAAIEDNCAVRSMENVVLQGVSGGIGMVTVDPRGRIVTSQSGGRTIKRFLPNGSLDTAFGAGGVVRLSGESGGLRPLAVSDDGTIWTTGFESVSRTEIVVFEISPNGQTIVKRTFAHPGLSVVGTGAVDASGTVLLSAMFRRAPEDPGVLRVFNVKTGAIVREVSGLNGPDARSVSASGVTVIVGDEVVPHSGSTLVFAAAQGEIDPAVNVAVRTGDTIIFGGSATPRINGFPAVNGERSAMIGSLRAGPAGATDSVTKLGYGDFVSGLLANGTVVAEQQRSLNTTPGVTTMLDISLVDVDYITGEARRLAFGDNVRTNDANRPADLVEMTNGESWVVAPASDSSVFLAQVRAETPRPPRPGALADQVERLYRAYFKRAPDSAGQTFWEDKRINGAKLADVSQAFASSPEFVRTYGSLDNGEFVDLVYRNVLGRAPEAAGFQFWLNELSRGVSRGQVMTGFSESAEFVATTNTVAPSTNAEGQITRLYRAYFAREPDADGFCFWTGRIDALGLAGVSQIFASSTEFNATYGDLDDSAFVDLVYRNVLGRQAEATGRAYWIGRLSSGMDRGSLMVQFSESPEFVRRSATPPPS